MLVSTGDTLAEMPGAFTIDADFSIAGDGTAFYRQPADRCACSTGTTMKDGKS